jgi:DNA-binding winged helix-turn-helix (wHTH) protein
MRMRFEDFELDLDLGELRRVGSLVKLERIPMKLLCLLVVRHGEVLTRPEIIETLWGKDIYKDTDNGINTAIRNVRIALRDQPEARRLVSTVPGRGYRFTGVLLEEPKAASIHTASQAPIPEILGEREVSGEVVSPQEALTQLNKADQFRPNSAINHQRVSHVYASLGRYDEAISEEEKSRILNVADPETGVATARKLRAAYLKRGTRGYWEEELELTFAKDSPPEFYHGDYGRAIIYAQLGESRKAMEALNQAVAEHDMRLTELAMEPLFKPLCSNTAFSDLKKKIGVDTNSPAVAISSR